MWLVMVFCKSHFQLHKGLPFPFVNFYIGLIKKIMLYFGPSMIQGGSQLDFTFQTFKSFIFTQNQSFSAEFCPHMDRSVTFFL